MIGMDFMRHPERLNAHTASLFLDIDGTLAPLMPRPDEVRPNAVRTALMKGLCGVLEGRLAVLSGRPIAKIDYILSNSVRCVAGTHGLERRDFEGERRDHFVSEDTRAALDQARLLLMTLAEQKPGVIIETKGKSVGAHYRLNREAEAMILTLVQNIAQGSPLILQRGDCVAELRAPGPDKGDALKAFMSEPPFEGRVPIFVGDDLTDEQAFKAATALGGHGILVGAPRPTAALYNLPDVAAVLDWLEAGVAHHA